MEKILIDTKHKLKLKERFSFYQKQKKFAMSVLDWSPYFDWYFLLAFFAILLVSANTFAYGTYRRILHQISQEPSNIILEKEAVDLQKVQALVEEFQAREEILNNLR